MSTKSWEEDDRLLGWDAAMRGLPCNPVGSPGQREEYLRGYIVGKERLIDVTLKELGGEYVHSKLRRR